MDTTVLIQIFEEARKLVSLPDNDFTWSSWEDSADAREEIDGVLERLQTGQPPGNGAMNILFAPTGPLQEVSLSSGWGDHFLELADKFDAALASRPKEATD
jgi:hypothetical protein